MKFRNIFLILKKEIRGILRDKKSLTKMIGLIFIAPIFVFIMTFLFNSMMSDDNTNVMGVNYDINMNEQSILSELNFETKKYNSKEELDEAYKNGEIDLYILKTDNKYDLYADTLNMSSTTVGQSAIAYLENYNRFLSENYLISEDIEPEDVYNIINYEIHEINEENTNSNYYANSIIQISIPYIILILASIVMICTGDLTAGEKERGTLETLLTFPLKSEEIIFGKYLAIFLTSLVGSFVCFAICIASLKIVTMNFTELFENVVFSITFGKILLTLVILLCSALILSGIGIALASNAKSYKEADSSLASLNFISMIPMFLPMFGVKTNLILTFIPVISQGMILNDIYSSNINITYLIIMFVSSIIYIVVLIMLISKQYKSEKVLFSL